MGIYVSNVYFYYDSSVVVSIGLLRRMAPVRFPPQVNYSLPLETNYNLEFVTLPLQDDETPVSNILT